MDSGSPTPRRVRSRTGWGWNEYKSAYERRQSTGRYHSRADDHRHDATARDPTVRAVRPRCRRRAPGRPPSPAPARRAARSIPRSSLPDGGGREISAALAAEGVDRVGGDPRRRGRRLHRGQPEGRHVGPEHLDRGGGARRRRARGRARAVRGGGRRVGQRRADEPLRPRPGDGRRRSSTPGSGSSSGSSTCMPSASRRAGSSRSSREASWSSASRSGRTSLRSQSSRWSCRDTRQASPVFARPPMQSLEEAQAELESDWGDPKWTIFVAEHEGRVIGSSVGCALEISSGHAPMMRPARRRLPRLRGGAPGRARPRCGTGARRGGPRLDARRGLRLGDHRLALDEPRGGADLADPRLPPDVPARCIGIIG